MQALMLLIFGTPRVAPLLVRRRSPGFVNRLRAAPSSVRVNSVFVRYFSSSLVISPTVIQGICPPKYRGSPAGRGLPPREISNTSWRHVQVQLDGSLLGGSFGSPSQACLSFLRPPLSITRAFSA